MNKGVQRTLGGKELKSDWSGGDEKGLRLEEVFIADLILANVIIGDTYEDILKRIELYAPMIRWNNESMIKSVLRKMENMEIIETMPTSLGLIVKSKDFQAKTKAREFFEKIFRFGSSL